MTVPQFESLDEAAARWSVHPATLRRAISESRLEGFKFGHKCIRVRPSDVDALFRPIPVAA